MDFHGFTSLERLIVRLLELWPDHRDYVEKSFDGRTPEVMEVSDQVAACTLKLGHAMEGGLDGLIDDYRFLCEKIVLPEELHFRRNNRYRLSKFEDAMRECYDNEPYMARYMNGLLVSNVLWSNHAQAISSYVREYLPSLKPGSDFLEVGPGHGLFTYFAATSPNVETVTGWDVSPTSIEHTRYALKVLGVTRPITLMLQNLFAATSDEGRSQQFDSIVMSEILEHLENPVAAIRAAMDWLKPRGEIWINVPANSPAPDHIFLVNSPEHACELAEAAGLRVAASHAFPMTGTTLEKARKRTLAISCVVVAQKPE
jgi:2-polyprenyl-3-methyl-5-hydroxy-6-metoxy-1,4-benzoquinol methylase